ncbi:hypothetical protein [uncultured Roseibium sp.]|uniref:hypothetical protein n=1 Tax=uncultured Roseibium sp. TaxID=1936171 RepID=UPI00262F1B6B|nr:hypothetical protein [uncultured Roseibium sp.]
MFVTIKSEDGTSDTVRVYDPDGKPIPGIMSIDISARVNDFVRATIELSILEVSTMAEACFVGPGGKEIARIVYVDGSEDVYKEGWA